ncbi:B-box zinc finger protein 23-like [Carya illinoinensis]|uniref:B-box zinc finger protein 23-like n=1 Tax=Carya illinoinensis TaxID=32201 RepID=UPI001C727A24|nr:B-box zinc finger protein 23-like [Carya illinoinensis]
MKIKCDVCEKLEAEVLCCADEAVLCRGCDEKVHAANKLSQKHERVRLLKHPLSSSSSSSSHPHLPPCDVCQERNGHFFCLEDRVLLCRHCDVTTHTGTPYASPHKRFLIAGLKVALEPSINHHDIGFNSGNSSSPMSNSSFSFPADNESRKAMTMEVEAASSETRTFSDEPHFATELLWSLDEIFDLKDFNCYKFSEVGSSSTPNCTKD